MFAYFSLDGFVNKFADRRFMNISLRYSDCFLQVPSAKLRKKLGIPISSES